MDDGTGNSASSDLKARLLLLRREVLTVRSKVVRRRADRAKVEELTQRIESGDAATRTALERVLASLQRRLRDEAIQDGDDDALAQRLAAAEAGMRDCERAINEQRQRDRARPDAPAQPTGIADKQRARQLERCQRDIAELRTVLSETSTALQYEGVAALGDATAAGSPPAVSPTDVRNELAALREWATSLNETLRKAVTASRFRQAAHRMALTSIAHTDLTSVDASLDALGKHLRAELQHTVRQVERHFLEQWSIIVERADQLLISRIASVDAQPTVDPSYETLSFRATDVRALSAYLRMEVWPILHTESRLLPQRSRLGLQNARGRFPAWAAAILPAHFAGLAEREDLLIPTLPKATVLATTAFAGELKLPDIGRVDVSPRKRFLRGDRIAAVGQFLKEVSRTPALMLGPLMGLAYVGINVISALKKEATENSEHGIWIGVGVLVASAVVAAYMLHRKERLAEQTALDRAKTQLRELLRKRGEDVAQLWRKHLEEHGELNINRALTLLRYPAITAFDDEVRRVAKQRLRAEQLASDAEASARRLDAIDQTLQKLLDRQLPDAERVAAALGDAP